MGILIAAVLVLVVLASGLVLYQVVRQQGRLLLRIEQLERLLGVPAHGAFGIAEGGHAPVVPVGLPVGSRLEPFTLTDLDGREVSLEEYRGRKVVLVHWSPSCGYCDAIGPELAEAVPALERAGAALVLLAHGDAAANRALAEKHGIAAPILLLDGTNPAGFQGLGTPSAFLVDADGKVATTVAVGAGQVPILIDDVVAAGSEAEGSEKKLRGQRSLRESRLVRDGLKAGTPAPSFTLPDLDGNAVSLEDFRGQQVLLAFTDPDCGPCDALAPHLTRLHREHAANNLAVVLVGRGDVEANRKKAAEHGFEFPVVIQEGWKLSRQYGIFATPVAFLIDEKGTISRDVAQGVDAIVSLVPPESAGHG